MKHTLPLLTALLLSSLATLHAADTVTPPGDRNLPINQVYPPEAFYHNGKGGRVLDVSKPPFNAKGDGKTDDTKALCAAMRFVADNYEVSRGEGERYSFCFPKLDRSWVIYLPNGEYLVSDTVSQGWPELVWNINDGWSNVNYFTVGSPEEAAERKADVYAAANWFIRLVGQSRAGTVIRLKDGSAGFESGSAKAVVSFYMTFFSNVNQGNYFENLTIDTGKDNPGAVGLKWNGSNWGGIRNAAIRAGDGRGHAGLAMNKGIAQGYVRDLLVEGFDTGVDLGAGYATMIVLEHATLRRPLKTALRVGHPFTRDTLVARKVLTEDAPLAFKADLGSHLILLDSAARARNESGPAIEVVSPSGHLFARDVSLSGYGSAVVQAEEPVVQGDFIEEFVSDEPISVLGNAPVRSLRLPVKDTPVILPEPDLRKWASVEAFGAKGDGLTDDTDAVQRAMTSGKPVVWFPKAAYVINGQVEIPATVREVCFLHASVYRTDPAAQGAMFKVSQPSSEPLLLRQNHNAGGIFVDHEADRPLVLEDVHTWFHHGRGGRFSPGIAGVLFPGAAAETKDIWQLYRNTRPDGAAKEVFASNVMGFGAGGEGGHHAVENVRAWVRQLNNEHLPGSYTAFRRSEVSVLGFKSEGSETVFDVSENSKLEVLGGTLLYYNNPKTIPLVLSRDSLVSLVLVAWGKEGIHQEDALSSEDNGTVTTVPVARLPKMGTSKENDFIIPLLTNDPKESTEIQKESIRP